MSRARWTSHGKLLLMVALALQVGCSWVDRQIIYEDAKETPPLKVPGDLIAPAPNPALQVPAVQGVASNVDTAPPTLGNTVAVARSGFPRAANAVLPLADATDSAFRRVGIALERSQCCKVLAKNPEGLSYDVELASPPPRPGLFKRMFGAEAPSARMIVQVAQADAGSIVTVVDASGATRKDDPAMTVLGAVEARLR
ncbi:MAG: hypothetical protein R3F18_12200 [Lysobacterales bacterium]|nr:outer membrane protein assembly factor BamC [Xanthomonadales bacterium]